jgi:hypothetical protein
MTDERAAVPPQTAGMSPARANDETNTAIVKYLKDRLSGSKDDRKQHMAEWRSNVDRRLGGRVGIFAGSFGGNAIVDEAESQAEINPDWSLTKTKTANLYSQLPTVQLTHVHPRFGPAVGPLAKSLNYELGDTRAHISVAMMEVLNDVVNAAGIGGVEVGYAARFTTKTVAVEDTIPGANGQPLPTTDLSEAQLQQLAGAGILHLKTMDVVVSDKFYVSRFSPSELITPAEFLGSCFDDADYVGRSGAMSWAEGKSAFNLNDQDKETLLAGFGTRQESDTLRSGDIRGSALQNLKVIHYDTLYYWRHRFDPEEQHFDSIWKMVFVEGKDEPVIHEAWKGQQLDPQTNTYIGSLKFPIRFLTLTYITDNPIPPSDTAAGRPQVNDMRRSRRQMFENRERSQPMRWFDVNRVDPTIQDLLMKGNWQGMIPSNGPGDRAFGEVARASYPSEDLAFDRTAKDDLNEVWHLGTNQQGVGGGVQQTATQVTNVQANFATVIGQDRAATATFFLGICSVLTGLLALYSDFPLLAPDEREAMEKAWDRKHILHDLAFTIRPDATIMLDSRERFQRLSEFLNLTVKSGFVNPLPILAEMAELSGLDPSLVVVPPQPKGPEEPNISFRFSGKDDLMNPMVAAMLAKHQQLPTPDEMNAAKAALRSAQSLDAPESSESASASPAAPPGAGGVAGSPPPEPATPEDAHPGWTLGSRVMKRSRDMQ